MYIRNIYLHGICQSCISAIISMPCHRPYCNFTVMTLITNKLRRSSTLAFETQTVYTSSTFLFTDYPLYFFCLQFTAQTVIFDNVARDRYLTKDFNNGLGNEVRPNWRSRNTDSSSRLYLDISTIYHALTWHDSSAFLLPVKRNLD